MMLMGFDQSISGYVESLGRGIDNSNDAPGHLGLPNVAATFSWVRLAQRIPVRIHINRVPSGVELAAGMTATVEIIPVTGDASTGGGHETCASIPVGPVCWPVGSPVEPTMFRTAQ
ncbi:hypothetical protein ACWGNA_18530 [Brucella cytisi]